MLIGNIGGLKASYVKRLEGLAKRATRSNAVISPELARSLTEVSFEIQRQTGLVMDRRGHVQKVVVGDARTILLPELPKRGYDRLSGLRFVHTHLHREGLSEEDLTDLALLRLDYVAVIEVLEDGLPGKVYQAHLLPANEGDAPWEILPPSTVHQLPEDFSEAIDALEEEFARMRKPRRAGDNRDRALLVHVSTLSPTQAQDSLLELRELARSAGLVVVGDVSQRRPLDPKYVTGKGKFRSMLIKAMQLGAGTIVFDLNLSPSQVKGLSDFTDLKILDRTQVILDIFAQHAMTREGQIQVELAQLRYRLPFLGLRQTALSRLTGGIGGRGPGETRLEIDRRRARDRIARLEREVDQLGRRRELRRGVRTTKGVPTVAVVGYTNAGKSTLLNNLTNSAVIAEDALFATLNPVSRRLRFPREREIIITDTVGFIRSLPKDLMAAFRSTFEELHDADLLLHVMDASSQDFEEKYETVRELLTELDLNDKPIMHIVNKTDLAEPATVQGLVYQYNGIPVCALDRNSFAPLLETMEHILFADEEVHAECI
ncbi:MAG TPA: GTPase HflX [Candidatus Hydrogenedentes bacterium]|nr:GTPase HflX [Candidatus Hydrogenedentota bacterium]